MTGCTANGGGESSSAGAGGAATGGPAGAPDDDGVIVALLDTGISTVAIDSACILPGYNYVLGSEDTEDRINHGTAIASVIVGCESAGVDAMASGVKLVPLVIADKVDGETKSITHSVLAQAVRDAVDKYSADIINLSLGIKTDSAELRKAVEYADNKGVLVISAVGNDGYSDELYYPAAYDTVLGVGSCDKYGEESDFSQKNGTADILAPGEDIWLASRNGKTYGTRGTSYATGYVSAKAAEMLKSSTKLSPYEIRAQLRDMAVISVGITD